jgi:hypothetical protein
MIINATLEYNIVRILSRECVCAYMNKLPKAVLPTSDEGYGNKGDGSGGHQSSMGPPDGSDR